jgi:hypothetical protein
MARGPGFVVTSNCLLSGILLSFADDAVVRASVICIKDELLYYAKVKDLWGRRVLHVIRDTQR